jgi:hypothetical protein
MNAKEKEEFFEFVARMVAIAAKNDDDFDISVTRDRNGHHAEVIETADRHTFIEGRGQTNAEAIANALASLPEALKSWGYEDADAA